MPQFVQRLFDSVTGLLLRAPSSIAVPLLMTLSPGIVSWLCDTDDIVAELDKTVKKQYHGMVCCALFLYLLSSRLG